MAEDDDAEKGAKNDRVLEPLEADKHTKEDEQVDDLRILLIRELRKVDIDASRKLAQGLKRQRRRRQKKENKKAVKTVEKRSEEVKETQDDKSEKPEDGNSDEAKHGKSEEPEIGKSEEPEIGKSEAGDVEGDARLGDADDDKAEENLMAAVWDESLHDVEETAIGLFKDTGLVGHGSSSSSSSSSSSDMLSSDESSSEDEGEKQKVAFKGAAAEFVTEFKSVMSRFRWKAEEAARRVTEDISQQQQQQGAAGVTEPEATAAGGEKGDGEDGGKASKKRKRKGNGDSSSTAPQMSRKMLRRTCRPGLSDLKLKSSRPDLVEVWDTTAIDPEFLVYLKSVRNTVKVPIHWSMKRRYLGGKRITEKAAYKLPDYVEATKIAEIRASLLERDARKSLKQKQREKARPKSNRMHIDFQVLHDAFFKYATKPPLSLYGDVYFEGKEKLEKSKMYKPKRYSLKLREALGMVSNLQAPPWLFAMQRFGPPPSYPGLKIPGLNCPLPPGAEWGYGPNGWGSAPTDSFGNPLYPEMFETYPSAIRMVPTPEEAEADAVVTAAADQAALTNPKKSTPQYWGEPLEITLEDDDSSSSEDEMEQQQQPVIQAAAGSSVESAEATSVVTRKAPKLSNEISGAASTATTSGIMSTVVPFTSGILSSALGPSGAPSGVTAAAVAAYATLQAHPTTGIRNGSEFFSSAVSYQMPGGIRSSSSFGRRGTRTPLIGGGGEFAGHALKEQLHQHETVKQMTQLAAGQIELNPVERKKPAKRKVFKF